MKKRITIILFTLAFCFNQKQLNSMVNTTETQPITLELLDSIDTQLVKIELENEKMENFNKKALKLTSKKLQKLYHEYQYIFENDNSDFDLRLQTYIQNTKIHIISMIIGLNLQITGKLQPIIELLRNQKFDKKL